MYWRMLLSTLCAIGLLAFGSCGNKGDNKGSDKGEEEAVRQQSKAFDEAFNKHDYNAIVALWSETGKRVDAEIGKTATGRGEILKAYQEFFEGHSDITLETKVDELAFPTKDTAIEAGTATLKSTGQEPVRTAFKAYYEKENGQWLLTQIREVNLDFPPTNYEQLKVLEWLVGDWIDEDEDSKIETQCKWDKYKNFLTQHFTVTLEGQMAIDGQVIIAWDPIRKQIRSWVFDSDGAFGQGTWRQEGKSWVVEAAQTLADGKRASAINIYTPVDQDSYTWESTGRQVGGVMLPNIPPVENKRKKG